MPFELNKRESPDFEIKIGTTFLGVETMEAVNRSYAHADALRNDLDHDTVLDKSYFKWGADRDRGEIETILSHRRLTGRGWHGDSVEREFAQSIADCVNGKHSKLVNEYCRFEKNYLLIYHNNATPCIDFLEAMTKTDERLGDYWSEEGFDAMFVLKYDCPTRLIIFSKEYPAEILVEGEGTNMRRKRQSRFGLYGGGSGAGQPARGAQGEGGGQP